MNTELKLSSYADNGSFALEYFLIGKKKDNLLKQGIDYCDLIIESSKEFTSKEFAEIIANGKFDDIDTIQKYHKKDDLVEYSKTAETIKKVLQNIIEGKDVEITEIKIRYMQDFFNKTSLPLLRGEMRKLRKVRHLW